jgi:2-polyprenyl-6-methoxyphenol hydroxylase-like FAD-dependent oxidoreductase
VIGASVAGLLAARVLAEHFKKVTVLERDPESAGSAPRRGVPQGRHIHILLPGGAAALDRLFPGRLVELVGGGAKRFDYGGSRFYVSGTWLPRVATDLCSFAQTRPFLEQHLRRWVSELPAVSIVDGANVAMLVFDDANSRVSGVELEQAGNAGKQYLPADLVIDATGRNTQLPRWLSERGLGDVPLTRVDIDLGYATGRFEVPEDVLPDHPMLYIVGPPPQRTRVGVIFQVENGIVFGGLGGYHGDHPPADLEGFLAFARSLSQPHVFDVLGQAKLSAPIVRFRIPAAVRRHYLEMRAFPHGILPIGDAICHLDPAFGQGMTMAAREAEILLECLRWDQGSGRLRREYLRQVESCLDVPWNLSCGEIFKYRQTSGRRPWSFPLTRRYRDLLATSDDPRVIDGIYRVISLTAPPRILLRPAVAARAVKRAFLKACDRKLRRALSDTRVRVRAGEPPSRE